MKPKSRGGANVKRSSDTLERASLVVDDAEALELENTMAIRQKDLTFCIHVHDAQKSFKLASTIQHRKGSIGARKREIIKYRLPFLQRLKEILGLALR